MPIGRDNYEPAYSAGIKADASERPDYQTKNCPYCNKLMTVQEVRDGGACTVCGNSKSVVSQFDDWRRG